jgi:hypothetical protein
MDRSLPNFCRYTFCGGLIREWRTEQEFEAVEQVATPLPTAQHSSFETQQLFYEKMP